MIKLLIKENALDFLKMKISTLNGYSCEMCHKYDELILRCKKRLAVFPSPAGMSLTKLWPGIIKFFPARESLVSDIPAGD